MPQNLISTIAQVFNSDLVARIASSLGIDKSMIERALGASAPALLGAFGSLASRPGGAAALNAEVQRQEPQLFQNLGPLIGGANMNARINAGSSTLKTLIGSSTLSQLVNAVSRYSGVGEVGTTNLIGLLGPVVMSVLSDKQRSSGLSPADLIVAEKDSIARALPAGVADSLGKSGILDWFSSSQTPGTHQAAEPEFEFRREKARRSGLSDLSSGSGWIVPALAALAVGLAWYLLSGPSTTDVAKNVPPPPQKVEAPLTTGALPEPRLANLASLDSLRGIKVGDVDLGTQVTDAVNGLRTALSGIRDDASAEQAMDPLKRSVTEFDRLKGLANQLSPEMRKTLAGAIAGARPVLDGLFDKALQIPGVSALIKPTIDSIRSELDTLATA